MAGTKPSGALTDLYQQRIGTPTTDDEVNGYWLFAAGVLFGLLGVLVFATTAPRTTGRAIGYALVALSPPLAMIGAIVRFPLRRSATSIATLGGVLAVAAVLYFLAVFPEGWSTNTGNAVVNGLYAAGIVLIGLAGAIVPLITDPVREEYEELQRESAGTTTELEEARERIRSLSDELATTEAELEAVATSRARFELFEDRGGKSRWRLRHRNGNVIADSAQGYSSRQKAQQGMHSVKRNALGAGVLRLEPDDPTDETGEPVPEDAEDPDVAVPTESAVVESQATFELFEDAEGGWRWRLRHDNGNVIADSGEGYASKGNAKRAMDGVRRHAATGDYLRIDPAAFELYRDKGGDYRWRLLHENGEILADSGESYSSRAKARQGAESVRSNVADADVEEQ